jgi:cation:H+ antiporter
MVLHLFFIIAGLVLLAAGAEGLVRGAGAVALRLGVAPLVVGLTIVAFGTGSPELVLSVQAAVSGNGGIALGNVLGSNISNIALVLGVAALVRPMTVQSRLIRREAPVMIAATVLLVVLLVDGGLGRLDGALLLAGAALYVVFACVGARQGDIAVVTREFDEALRESPRSGWRDPVLVIGGLAALVVGADVLLRGAVSVASAFGVSEVVVGLTVIAIGTSLPELATSVTAARRGQADVAFGNAIGSNVFNILAVLGVAALVHPIAATGLRPLDVGVFVLSAVVLLPLLARGRVLDRREGGVLVAGYCAYILSLAV